MSVLEIERSALEELERIEKSITDRIIYNPKILPDNLSLSSDSTLNGKKKRPLRETVLHEIEVSKFLKRYQNQCEYLDSIFNDKRRKVDDDSPSNPLIAQRKAEINSLGKHSGGSKELLDQYYEQTRRIKDFYRKYPNEGVEDLELTYAMPKTVKKEQRKLLENEEENTDGTSTPNSASLDSYNGIISAYASGENINLDLIYSGEEYYGKYVDLVSNHERFLNLEFIRRQLTYIQYLDKLSDFSDKSIYSTKRLKSPEYFEYIVEVRKYLEGFYIKTRILGQPELTIKRIEEEFESLWESKKYPSWIKEDIEETTSTPTGTETSASDPLFCVPCAKKFTNEALYNNHLPGRKHKRNAANQSETSNSTSNSTTLDNLKLRTLASHEYTIYCLSELLTKVISSTKSNIERRQALTDRERRLEIETLEREATGANDSSSSDGENDENDDENSDDEVIYNPLKLPLGWDGKPIPFWLYKYQGLGVEFECEICGNARYAGRKTFEKHFLEPRHVHGLKCLGIKPDPLFKGITKLSDAITLWEKLKKGTSQTESKPENTIEMEDEEGNVMSQRVYNDLKKQGLI